MAAKFKKAEVVIKRDDFNREYIGFSAAIEWIARADFVLPGKDYIAEIYKTLRKLIDLLRNPEPGMTIEKPVLFSFFNLKSYLMMFSMISLGITLRLSVLVTPEHLALMYVTMGIPLLMSSIRFYAAFFSKLV